MPDQRARQDWVFLGPSLPAAEAAVLLPGAVILPPVQLGDLCTLDIHPGDRVLIIDGLFLHVAPVRHREILDLLRRGVIVAGASSMGALRAAELAPFGMRGVGQVYQLYADGAVVGDDEVAVVHGPAEEGYRILSEPLVNIRIALTAAVQDSAISAAEADALLALVAALPFRARTYRALHRLATAELGAGCAGRFAAWLAAHPMDVKRSDARQLLRMAATDDPALRPADATDRPIENVHTSYFRGWRAYYGGESVAAQWVSDAQVAAALALLHPDYPRCYRRRTLALLVESLSGTVPDGDLAARVVELADENGLVPTDRATEPDAWGWLGPAEADLPRAEAVARTLARAAGTVSTEDLSTEVLPAELSTAPMLAAARAVTARSLTFAAATATALASADGMIGRADRVAERGGVPALRFRPEVVDAVFAGLWDCPVAELELAAWDRGLADLRTLRELAQPFLPYLRSFGRPSLPEVD